MRLSGILSSVGLILAGPMAFACGVLGADDYELVDRPGPDSGMTDREVHVDAIGLPILPAQPDGHRIAACEACVETECADRRRECLESERCKAMLWCHGRCRDPACWTRCRDTLPESPVFDRYSNCAFSLLEWLGEQGKCLAECGAGDNLECWRAYDWEQPEFGEAVHLRLDARAWVAVQAGPVAGFPGAWLGSCVDGDEAHLDAPDHGCTRRVQVDAYGTAEMDVPYVTRAALAMWVHDVERIRLYRRPYPRDGGDLLNPAGLAFAQFLRVHLGEIPWDPERGLVTIAQLDCLGAVHQRARFSLKNADGQTTRWYDAFNPTADKDFGGWGGFVNAPIGSHVLVESESEDRPGEILSKRKVVIAPGWTTMINLWPLLRGEL